MENNNLTMKNQEKSGATGGTNKTDEVGHSTSSSRLSKASIDIGTCTLRKADETDFENVMVSCNSAEKLECKSGDTQSSEESSQSQHNNSEMHRYSDDGRKDIKYQCMYNKPLHPDISREKFD